MRKVFVYLKRNILSRAAGSVAFRVASLGHEAGDDAVEGEVIVEARVHQLHEVGACNGSLIDENLGLERILIFDWDVHHGNGTNDLFYSSDKVVYASIHQSPLYPGSGQLQESGSGEGEGFTLNMPVPPGAGPEQYLSLIQNLLMPVLEQFNPQLVLVSAGYDAHADDPLANVELESNTFAEMSSLLRNWCSQSGVGLGFVVEGGYNLKALANSVTATLRGTVEPTEVERMEPDGLTRRCLSHFAKWWKVL